MKHYKSSLIRALSGISLALTALSLFRLSQTFPDISAILRTFGLRFGGILCRIWSIIPFPISELVWILGIASSLALMIILTKRQKWEGLIKALSHLLLAGGTIALIFSAVFLVQYSAPPLSDTLGLEVREYRKEELFEATRYVASLLNTESAHVNRDEKGCFAPKSYEILAEKVQESYKNGSMSALWSRGSGISPKEGVLLSRIMSYLGITGYYFPLTGESIVSSDLLPTSVPFTIAHETSHAFGIGPEKEANFAAFLCGVESDDCDVRYSCLLSGYIYLHNALYKADIDLWREVYYSLDDGILADLAAKSERFDKYDTSVQDIGEKVNDTYIKATGQPDGIKSYGLMVDLILAYYNR